MRLVCALPMAESERDQSKPVEVESYEIAVERLEQIIDRLDSGQAGLRETLDLCREGRELVATARPSWTRSARASRS